MQTIHSGGHYAPTQQHNLQQQQNLRSRVPPGYPNQQQQMQPDFAAMAAQADQRRFQQLGYNPGQQATQLHNKVLSQSNKSSAQSLRQMQQQHNIAQNQSLNQAKAVLSQVLTNMSQSQDNSVNQSFSQLNNSTVGLRHTDFLPVQQQQQQPQFMAAPQNQMVLQPSMITNNMQSPQIPPIQVQPNGSTLLQKYSTERAVKELNNQNIAAGLGINDSNSSYISQQQQHQIEGQQFTITGQNNVGSQQLSFGEPYVQHTQQLTNSSGKSNARGMKQSESQRNNMMPMQILQTAPQQQQDQNRDQTKSINQYQQNQTLDQSQDKLKEQFFESLGLPGDLNNIQNYNFANNLGERSGRDNVSGSFPQNQNSIQQRHQDNKSPSTSAPAAAGQQNSSPQNSRREILTLTIEIGEGRNENILICEGDDPYQLAVEFDAKHMIGPQLRELLAEQIRQNIQQVQIEQFDKHQHNNDLSTIEGPMGGVGTNDVSQHDMQHLIHNDLGGLSPTQQYDNGGKVNNLLIPTSGQPGGVATFRDENVSLNMPQASFNQFDNNQAEGQQQILDHQPQYDALGYGTFQPDQIKNATNTQSHQQFVKSQESNGSGNLAYLNVPFSENYRSWQAEMNERLKNGGASNDVQQKPLISQGSRQIMEQKKTLANACGSSLFDRPVHERLHKAAIDKQQLERRNNRSSSQRGPNSNTSFEAERHEKQNLSGRAKKRGFQSAARKPPMPILQAISQRSNSQREGGGGTPTKGQGATSNANFGERLYHRGVKKREDRENRLRNARSEQHRAEIEGLTFQPQINSRKKVGDHRREIPTEELLINYGKRRDEVLNFQRALKAHKEAEEFDFRPQISRKSAKIMRNRSQILEQVSGRSDVSRRSATKFETLYQDAVRRNERQMNIYSACVDAECTFQPDRSRTKYTKRRMSSDHQEQQTDQTRSAFFDRLSQGGLNTSRERSQMMLANSKTLSNDLYDPETGQALFRPKVGRAPIQYRPKAGAGTSDHLYKVGMVSTYKKMTATMESHLKKQQDSNTVFTCGSTKKMMEQRKFAAFAQIFDWLDSDKDGHISADKIDISPLSADLLEVLSPLFMEMEELSQALDAEEFIDAAGRLYDSLSLPQKNTLLLKPDKHERSASNKRKHDPGHQYQPQINQKSKKIAQSRHSQHQQNSSTAHRQSVSDRLYQDAKAKQLMRNVVATGGTVASNDRRDNNLSIGTGNRYHDFCLVDEAGDGTEHLLDLRADMMRQQCSSQVYPNNKKSSPGGNKKILNKIQMFNSTVPSSQQQQVPGSAQSHNPASSQHFQSHLSDQNQQQYPQHTSEDVMQDLLQQYPQQQYGDSHTSDNIPLQMAGVRVNGSTPQSQSQQDQPEEGVDLNYLAHMIASEMLNNHLQQQQPPQQQYQMSESSTGQQHMQWQPAQVSSEEDVSNYSQQQQQQHFQQQHYLQQQQMMGNTEAMQIAAAQRQQLAAQLGGGGGSKMNTNSTPHGQPLSISSGGGFIGGPSPTGIMLQQQPLSSASSATPQSQQNNNNIMPMQMPVDRNLQPVPQRSGTFMQMPIPKNQFLAQAAQKQQQQQQQQLRR